MKKVVAREPSQEPWLLAGWYHVCFWEMLKSLPWICLDFQRLRLMLNVWYHCGVQIIPFSFFPDRSREDRSYSGVYVEYAVVWGI